MTTYRTVDGDMVDAICHAHYGDHEMVERVLDDNPGLADRGAVLPAGVSISLPDAPVRQVRRPLRLWGAS